MPDGAAALVVGRGGEIELGLVACLPAPTTALAAPLGHCDGARLGFIGQFVSIQFRRGTTRSGRASA